MQIIDKVCTILETLSKGDAMSVSEIAEEVEMPTPTTYRILNNLTVKGLLEKDLQTKRYSLGWKLVSYARNVSMTNEKKYLLNRITPHLKELAKTTEETVTLAVFTGTRVVLIAVIEGTYALRFFSEVGKEMPWTAAAPAKLFLAHQTPKVQEKIFKTIKFMPFTENTIVDLETYKGQLADVLKNDMAFSLNELDTYCNAIAVPVRDKKGRMIYALTVVGHVYRMQDHQEAMIGHLRKTAAKIEKEIRNLL